jgi:serine/threonine protein kinase/thioredoxin-like negative regulator of GroEL
MAEREVLKRNRRCPAGHQAAEGQRLCVTCGWVFSILPGDFIGESYEVCSSQLHGGQRYYHVQKDDASFVVAEFIEFLPYAERVETFSKLQRLFPDLVQDFLYHEQTSIRLFYVVYAAEYGVRLEQSLRKRMSSVGLLEAAEVQSIIFRWVELVGKLSAEGLVLPAFHMDLMHDDGSSLFVLNLHHCLSLKSEFIFPQRWEAVHSSFFKLLTFDLSFNQKLFRAAEYSFLAELITGLRPEDFYPEPISFQSYRALFLKSFLQIWENYTRSFDSHTLLKIAGVYRQETSLLDSIKKANIHFSAGKAHYQNNDFAEALPYFEQAREVFRLGAQIPRYIALCHQDYENAYFDGLGKALREESLACLYFDQAQGYKETRRLSSAIASFREAIRIHPFYPEAHFALAEVYLLKEKDVLAEQSYRMAIQQRASAQYYRGFRQFLMDRSRYEEAGALPEFSSSGSQKLVSDKIPSLSSPYSSVCPQGHPNSLDNVICQLCKLPLTLELGDEFNGYLIQEVLQQRQKDGEQFKGALYRAYKEGQVFFVKEYVIYNRVKSFEKAFAFLKEIRHEQLLPLEDMVTYKGFGYLLFPWREGVLLSDYLNKHYVIPQEQQNTFFLSFLSLLYYLQDSKLVHGDIKPENILLTADGPLLIDTDSLLYLENIPLFREPVYTFPYSAPEQQHKQLHLTSDAYGMAVTFIRAFTGISPLYFYYFDTQTFEMWEQYALQLAPSTIQWIKQSIHHEANKRSPLTRETLQYLFDLKYRQFTVEANSQNKLSLLAHYSGLNTCSDFDALERETQALLLMDSSSLSLLLVAKAHQRLGKWQSALEYVKRAIKLSPRNVRAVWLMAEIYESRELIQQAVQAYLLSTDHCGNFFGPHLWAARLLVKMGEMKPAILLYKKALDYAPHLPEITFELIDIFVQTQQLSNAEALLRDLRLKTTLSHADRFAVASLLAKVLALQHSHREALKELGEALILRPADQALHLDIAINAFALKDWPRVEKALLFILNQEKTHPEALYLLSQMYIEVRDFEKARDTLSFLLDKVSWRPLEVRFQLARAYTYLGELDKSQAIYEALLPFQQSLLALYINLGNVHLIKKENQAAKFYFEKAQQLSPESSVVAERLQQLC